ncbi:ISWI chromatin-remodeling complex ATPase ISW2 [Verticillium alfalfae VaMs.102]|uniref:ISWI chromatin-remodeling complex ATPase ISW2 n=1 Tax=Verticillium alfalfae (strain VaMs.102 / ATCC MYA-4576 / FGSC 10136) TaxID=526221 RepID=C9SGU0_VERA1|nr:ISWI chromatin-remodeling complex ATPase ISW2 [Verticillium alfalfae VaMs.102]EEY18184.1 ISWI chromatin-remodeling complex ATPase ISW2 [Verticillium alfalfae VaMs.102]
MRRCSRRSQNPLSSDSTGSSSAVRLLSSVGGVRHCLPQSSRSLRTFSPTKSANGANGKVKRDADDDENDEDSVLGMAPSKKKSKNGVKNKALDNIKSEAGSKSTSAAPSRASSVASTKTNGPSKSKAKGKKK